MLHVNFRDQFSRTNNKFVTLMKRTVLLFCRCSHCNLSRVNISGSDVPPALESTNHAQNNANTSRSCQTTPVGVPDSPPPAYEKISFFAINVIGTVSSVVGMNEDMDISSTGEGTEYITLFKCIFSSNYPSKLPFARVFLLSIK